MAKKLGDDWYIGKSSLIDETVEVARKLCEDLEARSNFSYETHSNRQFQEELGFHPKAERQNLLQKDSIRKMLLLQFFRQDHVT